MFTATVRHFYSNLASTISATLQTGVYFPQFVSSVTNVFNFDNRNLYISLLYCVAIYSIIVTAARLILYVKDPSNLLNQAIWGGLECLTAAHIVVAPTLCSLFSTAADKAHDQDMKTHSQAVGNESTENIISNNTSNPISNNILARYRLGTTALTMSHGQLHRMRNPRRLSRPVRMLNIVRPRASNATLDSTAPRGLGNHATCWANSGEFAPEGQLGILRTREVHVTREAWTDEDGPQIQTAQSGIAWINEAEAVCARSLGDYFGSSKW